MRYERTAMRYIAIIVVGLTALVFAFCFWPTLYRYESAEHFKQDTVLRIHRISGDAEYFFMGDWHRVGPANEPVSVAESELLPEADLSLIRGFATLDFRNIFSGELYNGSTWRVNRLRLRCTAKMQGDAVWSRTFDVPVSLSPLACGSFSVSNIPAWSGEKSIHWYIVLGYGTQTDTLPASTVLYEGASRTGQSTPDIIFDEDDPYPLPPSARPVPANADVIFDAEQEGFVLPSSSKLRREEVTDKEPPPK